MRHPPLTEDAVVVSLCDRTGNMVQPWAMAGFPCLCVDVHHPQRTPRVTGNIAYTWGDVRTWVPPKAWRRKVGILFAFPPCTHVARSGARDFITKGTALLRDSLELFSACYSAAQWAGCPYLIENPVGAFSSHIRKPDLVVQPWQYGDNYAKKTCLWTGNGFQMPAPTVDKEPEGVRSEVWMMPPAEDRQDKRSVTPMGLAKAVFRANVGQVRAYGRGIARERKVGMAEERVRELRKG